MLTRVSCILVSAGVMTVVWGHAIELLLKVTEAAAYRARPTGSIPTKKLETYDFMLAAGPWVGLVFGVISGFGLARHFERRAAAGDHGE